MTTRTVAQKMGVKDRMRMLAVDAPAESVAAMSLPVDPETGKPTGEYDAVQVFVTQQEDLDAAFPGLRDHVAPDGMLWVSWPKGRGLGSDLTLHEVIRIGYSHGMVESTCLSIDGTWSGLKFTWPKPGKEYHNSHATLTRKN